MVRSRSHRLITLDLVQNHEQKIQIESTVAQSQPHLNRRTIEICLIPSSVAAGELKMKVHRWPLSFWKAVEAWFRILP